MQRISVEIVNVDEDIAEQAVNTMLESVSNIIDPVKKSLTVEPHDETRGIWASFDLKEHPMSSGSSYKKTVVSAISALLNLQFHNVSKATVYVTLANDKGEQKQ